MDEWVHCFTCGMTRHGSNSKMLCRIHLEYNLDHDCQVLEGSETKPFLDKRIKI